MTYIPLTNEVIIAPLDEQSQVSSGGILLVNHYKKPTLKFIVLAVGAAGWVTRKRQSGKLVRVWRKPEVLVGERVICRAIVDSGIARHHFEDGTGRMIVAAEHILAKWGE